MKSFLATFLFLSFIIFVGCSSYEANIANNSDYNAYLNRTHDVELKKCNEELIYWSDRLASRPTSETYRLKVAGILSSRFMLNGKIEDIKSSDSIYGVILKNTTQDYASVHRALAANSITQHQFLNAYKEIQKALTIGEGKAASLYMLVDVSLELGDEAEAKRTMNKINNRKTFQHLIREAKIKDHEGDLDAAISLMENAVVKSKNNSSLSLWALSNLADMYGHAGRIRESYQTYLTVLKNNPDYDYALKGIAWIAFSHDHNYQEAKRIIHSIEPKRATPDMHLLLAKIAEEENDVTENIKQLSLFTQSARSAIYGDMYNKYLALLEAEEFSNPEKAIEIAKVEIHNRPTAQSYDLLAWGYFNRGNITEALAIAQENLVDQTFEPDAYYHLGMIYQANGFKKEARQYFEKADESSFELGPAISRKIKYHLNG